MVNPPKQAVSVFADTQSSEIKDRIFDEFNSLSVVYQQVVTILLPCKWFQIYKKTTLPVPFLGIRIGEHMQYMYEYKFSSYVAHFI